MLNFVDSCYQLLSSENSWLDSCLELRYPLLECGMLIAIPMHEVNTVPGMKMVSTTVS